MFTPSLTIGTILFVALAGLTTIAQSWKNRTRNFLAMDGCAAKMSTEVINALQTIDQLNRTIPRERAAIIAAMALKPELVTPLKMALRATVQWQSIEIERVRLQFLRWNTQTFCPTHAGFNRPQNAPAFNRRPEDAIGPDQIMVPPTAQKFLFRIQNAKDQSGVCLETQNQSFLVQTRQWCRGFSNH